MIICEKNKIIIRKNKGFTLIELLAVILIFAIIVLIAVPIVPNIIESTRKKAAEDSVNGVMDATKLYYAHHQSNIFLPFTVTFDGSGNETIDESSVMGYATSTINNSGQQFCAIELSQIENTVVDSPWKIGVRPVITVDI